MNEDSKDFKLIPNKPRSKKLKPSIDLTAMVSVSFLLIVFFMVTSYLSRPQAMDLGLSDKNLGCGGMRGGCGGNMQSERVITLLLDDNNKIIGYRGLLEDPKNIPVTLNYGKDIRKELLSMSKKVLQSTENADRGAIVIIKPSKKSNYGNLVDLLDEMAITKISTYVIVNDFSPNEMKLLASK